MKRLAPFAALAFFGSLVSPAMAETEHLAPGTREASQIELPRLGGVERDVATTVLATVRSAQDDVREGRKPPFPFTLTSGASILNDTVGATPRETFLALDLDDTQLIKRWRGQNTVLDVFELSIGSHRDAATFYWQARIWINVNGDIERIDLEEKLPPPF